MFYHLIFNKRNKINTLKDETLVNGFNANIYNFISSTIYKNFHSDDNIFKLCQVYYNP